MECFRDGNDKPGKLPRFSLFVMADGLEANSCVMSGSIGMVESTSELFYKQKNWPLLWGGRRCAKNGDGGGGAYEGLVIGTDGEMGTAGRG